MAEQGVALGRQAPESTTQQGVAFGQEAPESTIQQGVAVGGTTFSEEEDFVPVIILFQ